MVGIGLLALAPLTLMDAALHQRDMQRVLVLYSENTAGGPGAVLADQSIRSTFAQKSPRPIEVLSEFLDVSRFADKSYQSDLAEFLRRKYGPQEIDLIITGLASSLDFALEHRDDLFPGVPIVHCAVDRREIAERQLPPDVTGAPIEFDARGTLEIALALQPDTQRVYVITGLSRFDVFWEEQAKHDFAPYQGRLKFEYLTGLPLPELKARVASLPERSVILYLHMFRDRAGASYIPAFVIDQISADARAPIYGHVDSYVGRGVVGGRMVSFKQAGEDAAELALQILAGKSPSQVAAAATSNNVDMFDWRQIKRWNLGESSLPPGSIVSFREATFWERYKWRVLTLAAVIVVQATLITGLLLERAQRRRAEKATKQSQGQLRRLSGDLLHAQEDERRRIAREIHDDFNQSLALLCVDLELIGRSSDNSNGNLREQTLELSGRVKQLASGLHRLSHELHPLKLEQVGLVAAVRSLCQELSRSHGISISFKCTDSIDIDKDASVCLYRVAQESLHNVIKHSQATAAQMELGRSDGKCFLRLTDQGKGFDVSAAMHDGGLGLVSMRERLLLVGGQIEIRSTPGHGARVEAWAPINSSTDAEKSVAATTDDVALGQGGYRT